MLLEHNRMKVHIKGNAIKKKMSSSFSSAEQSNHYLIQSFQFISSHRR